MASLIQLRVAAKKHGATLVDESSGKYEVWQVEAPSGKLWACSGDIDTLRVEWRTGDRDGRDVAIKDAIERISYGLCDAEDE